MANELKKVKLSVDGQIYTLIGEQGEKGDKGDTGATGEAGAKGDTGATGPAGADGVTPSITATASVTSSGSTAVNVTKTGTDEAPTFDFAFTGIGGGGGGGGTSDYDELENRPQINGVTLTGNKTSADLHIEAGPKTYDKYVVVAVYGQSNSVGYDESPLTLFDIPVEANRIKQYSTELKALNYCADNLQDMKTINARSGTQAAMAAERAGEPLHEAYEDCSRDTKCCTKGIHLPLANLITQAIPADYGIIIVPCSYGGKKIDQFVKGSSSGYYTSLIERITAAMNLNANNIFGGIVWCQGENNAGNTSQEVYMEAFNGMISDFSTDLAAFAKRTPNGTLSEKDWYTFEWPVYWKNLDTTNILQGLKEKLGARYVAIPNDTPANTATYTSSNKDAHFGQNSFRQVIAPRVFYAMMKNGAFLSNVTDPYTDEMKTEIIDLKDAVVKLEQEVEGLYGWETPESLDAYGEGATYSDGTISFNDLNAGFLLPEGVTKFKYTTPTTNNEIVQLVCGLDSEFTAGNKCDTKCILTNFNTNVQNKWINCNGSYNTQVGANGSTQADINRVFDNGAGITVIVERLSDGTISVTTENGNIIFNNPNCATNRFGFVSWTDYGNCSITNLKILQPSEE